MVENNQITNKDAIKALIDGAQLPIQDFPNRLASSVVPVLDITPDFHRKINIVRTGGSATTGDTTIYTTPATRDFYLCSCFITSSDTATSDNTSILIFATIDGVERAILRHIKLTLVADNNTSTISFPNPIKIDRGTVMGVRNSFSVGTSEKVGGIHGFEVEGDRNR